MNSFAITFNKVYLLFNPSKTIIFPLLIYFILLNNPIVSAQIRPVNHNAEQKNEMARKWMVSEQITENQEKYDVNYYLIDYNFNVISNLASPEVLTEIRVTITEGPIDKIDLNFGHNYVIDSIRVNFIRAEYIHEEGLLTVELDRAYNNLEVLAVQIQYHGEPWALGEDYNGKPFFWTNFEPYGARNMFPCKDTPVDKADSADVKFTVPEGMIAVSNGNLYSKMAKGRNTTYWWKTKYPLATYQFFLAAYEYVHYRDWYVSVTEDSMPIDFYVVPEHLSNSQSGFFEIKNVISIFAELFGEYPFINEKYGHAEIPGSVSMAHQTCSSLGVFASLNGDYPLDLMVHELAHQWWGDMITPASFHDIWLNEGFATYAEALYAEATGGREEYQSVMKKNEYYGGGTVYVEDPENDDIFDYGLSYQKAGYVLHMLRHVVGESVFIDILRTYASDIRYKYGVSNTDDFISMCEEISGKNLQKFFQQWIYGEYFPHYSYGWSLKPVEEGYNIKIRIDQIQQRSGLFRMPIDLEVNTSSYTIMFTIQDSLQSQDVEFFVAEEPLNVQLDPENWILKRVESDIVFPYPYSENIQVNARYQRPGEDILSVRCMLLNPWNEDVEVTALIESFDHSFEDSLPLFDDGAHDDSTAGDGIYGGFWPVPLEEDWYSVSIKTQSLTSGYYSILPRKTSFTTTGPVALSDYEIINRDTLINPDDLIRLKYILQNHGISDTVFNVSTKTRSLDTCAQIIAFSDPEYGNIAPGETAEGGRPITLRFDEGCIVPENAVLALDIFSDNIFLWSDTFSVEIVSRITNENYNLPQRFALHQNYPNPFNPITAISYQLSAVSNVELVIYTQLGQEIATLVSEKQQTGFHQVEWNASGIASGVYFYRLSAGEFVDVKKMVLLR